MMDMRYSNTLPKGRIEGDTAILAFKATGLDGHSEHTVETLALTPHTLMALHQLTGDLILDLMQDAGADVTKLRKHG